MTCPRRGSDEVCEGINSMKMHIVHYFGLRIDARDWSIIPGEGLMDSSSLKCRIGLSTLEVKQNILSDDRALTKANFAQFQP